MNNIIDVQHVYWVNDAKDRVSAVFIFDDGTTDLMSVGVSPTSDYWQYIEANVSNETIDENTEKVLLEVREKRKLSEFRQQERDVQKKHNALFNAKIEAFDIPAVVNATSARKASIRKSKSVTEVIAQVAVCIMESEKNSQE